MAHEEFKSPGGETEEGNGSQQYDESGTVKERFQGGAQNVKEKLGQSFEQTRERGKKAVETIGQRVEEKPMITLLAAFGVGVLLGAMFFGFARGGPGQINKTLGGEVTPPPTM